MDELAIKECMSSPSEDRRRIEHIQRMLYWSRYLTVFERSKLSEEISLIEKQILDRCMINHK